MGRLAVKPSVAVAILSGCLVPVAPAFADFQVKKGTFTKPAATGSQAIGGVGFQPKALIFFWTRQTAEGLASHVQAGYGFATGPANERAISFASRDAVSFQGDTNKRQSQNRCIVIGDPGLSLR